MKENRFTFTKSLIEKLPLPEKGKTGIIYDEKESGLMLMSLSSGIKTFYLYRKINGKPERIKIGRFPDLSIENARNEARKLKGDLATGINPSDIKKKLRSEITFEALFKEYLEKYSKKCKKTWKADEVDVKRFLSAWFLKKISKITNADVRGVHQKLRHENGLYIANRTLERVRAIFNKAIEWGFEGKNPALGIKKYKEKSRERFLSKEELSRFLEALQNLESQVSRDYIMLSLLTGARKSNILEMKWKDINFDEGTWRIPETKNGESLTLPLSSKAIEILLQRKATSNSIWAFESKGSKTGHLMEPKRTWQTLLKKAKLEDLRIHDLRRTLGSWQAIMGTSLHIIGKSLGHKSQTATSVYARLNLDPIRESIETATKTMLK